MALKATTMAVKTMGKRALSGAVNLTGFAAKPLTNPVTGRAQILASRVQPKVTEFKDWYSQVGLPEEAKELNQKQRRQNFAIQNKRRN
jgi:hypothetical protein